MHIAYHDLGDRHVVDFTIPAGVTSLDGAQVLRFTPDGKTLKPSAKPVSGEVRIARVEYPATVEPDVATALAKQVVLPQIAAFEAST